MKKYDIAVIGSGAGLMVVEAALAAGKKCAIIEASKFGGTCLTKGCIPSKMLVYPAEIIREAQSAKRIGVSFAKPELNWDVVGSRMWNQINHSIQIEENLQTIENLTVYKGFASFVDANTLHIKQNDGNSEEIFAEKIVIAAGSRTFIPPIKGLEEAGYVTSETFFGEKFPKEKPWDSLIIVGGGAIGAEFAHIFSAFGTKVTIVEMRPRILSTEEEEISDFMRKQFENAGIRVLTSKKALAARTENGMKFLEVQDTETGQTETISASELFVASGVRSNADTLSPENAGIELDKRGWIVTDSYLRTSRDSIFAIGDINGKYQFRHKANYEAEILIQNLFGSGSKIKASYNAVPWAIFTHPQVGHVGLTEREIKELGIEYNVARNNYSSIAGGIAMGIDSDSDDNGFAKIIVDKSGKLLGVHVVGPQASILVQPFVYLMNCGVNCQKTHSAIFDNFRKNCVPEGSLTPIKNSMVIHPSLNELTAWAIEDL